MSEEINLTKEQAIDIIKWRNEGDDDDECDEDGNKYGLTWRAVAYTFIKYYPEDAKKWNIQHTQPYGMILCEKAFVYLKIPL